MNVRFKLSIAVIVAIAAISPTMIGALQLGSNALPEVRFVKTSPRNDEIYPYQSKRFTSFVDESYMVYGKGDAREFFKWMDMAYAKCKYPYPGKEKLNLAALTNVKALELGRIKDKSKKTQAEINLAAWTHRMIKSAIPKFSLDRGFEFHYTVSNGERQCFLQSVLVCGLLQGMGMDAGVVMVNKNPAGQESNNGHAVALLKLPNGADIIVDCSEPQPFPKHQGLFVRTADYRYVKPVYKSGSSQISCYLPALNGRKIRNADVRTLGYGFLRSQFYYYRGERVQGGLLAKNKTAQGMAASENFLRTSVKLCPENPLAVYSLGRACYLDKKPALAKKYIEQSKGLYSRFGWTPGGVKEYSGLVEK